MGSDPDASSPHQNRMVHFLKAVKAKGLGSVLIMLFLGCSSSWAAAGTIIVAADGSGDFKTIQEAIAVVPEGSAERTILRIKPGTYAGPVVVPVTKPLVSFAGEDAQTTIITWDRNVKDPVPDRADKTNPGVHILGAGFYAENLTFRNTSGDHGQALAVRVDADRSVFRKCRLLGWQDTLMVNKGRQYFRDCEIEGRVDFIYGDGVAVFEHCLIHSKNGGYITAASTPPEQPFGFVFLRCKLTGDAAPWVDPTGATVIKESKLPNTHLGRPWRAHGSVAFIECEMGKHIKPEGWHNWGKPEYEATARYLEASNTGPGASTKQRVPWARQLNPEEAATITAAFVLAGQDAWNPAGELAR